MATKNYMINDKWLDLDKQNIVELQSVDGVLDSLKVNGSEIETPSGKITITENGTDIDVAQYALADVNVEGGGGSSDFSTAEVIVVRGTPSPDAGAITDVPMIKNNILTVFTLDGSSTVPVISTVVLYKGRLVLDANPDTFISATGSASYDSDNEKLTILGDCTLTLSYIAFE